MYQTSSNEKLKPITDQAREAQERESDKSTEKGFSNKAASAPDSVIVCKLEQPCWKCKDNIIMQKYPERIQIRYSSVEKMKYPMNLCQHCKSKQGKFFIYERINQVIKDME